MTYKKKITINDVASLSGVSKKTVSRVINNETNVSSTTRNKVNDVIRRLDYTPDPQARGLAFKRSYLLALVYDNPNAAFVSGVIHGVLDRCRPEGYELVVHPCDAQDDSFVHKILDFIKRLKIDGIIIPPPLSESKLLTDGLKQANCSYVRLLSVIMDDAEYMVHYKDREAVTSIADHLVSLGHTDIGFIQGAEGYLSAKERYEGFKDALQQQNIKLPTSRVGRGDYTFQSGVHCAEWLLSSSSPPTAIFACNDEMAMGVIVAAEKMGFKIPTDLSVVGFDDNPYAVKIWPSLTTVNMQVKLMGHLATEKLLALCKGDTDRAKQVQSELSLKFIQRQSTAPPRTPS